MTKADLVDKVSQNSSLTKKDAEIIVQEVLDSIIDTLNSGEKVELRDFGSFRHRERRARQSRNPKTGEVVHVSSKRVPYFKLGKQPKVLINL